MYLIYLIKNKTNGKSYVGWTSSSVENRIKRHIMDLKSKRYRCRLHDSIKHYGIENFIIETLCTSESKEEIKELEKYYIKELNTHYISGYGYNMTMGGDGTSGYKQTEECKRKKNAKIRLTKSTRPYTHNEERKNKIKSTRTLQDMSFLRKRYVITFPDGRKEETNNLKEFCLQNKLNLNCMRLLSTGAIKSTKSGHLCCKL